MHESSFCIYLNLEFVSPTLNSNNKWVREWRGQSGMWLLSALRSKKYDKPRFVISCHLSRHEKDKAPGGHPGYDRLWSGVMTSTYAYKSYAEWKGNMVRISLYGKVDDFRRLRDILVQRSGRIRWKFFSPGWISGRTSLVKTSLNFLIAQNLRATGLVAVKTQKFVQEWHSWLSVVLQMRLLKPYQSNSEYLEGYSSSPRG